MEMHEWRGHQMYSSGPCTLPWSVVGNHDDLGAGVLGYFETEEQAERNAKAIRVEGGKARVEYESPPRDRKYRIVVEIDSEKIEERDLYRVKRSIAATLGGWTFFPMIDSYDRDEVNQLVTMIDITNQ